MVKSHLKPQKRVLDKHLIKTYIYKHQVRHFDNKFIVIEQVCQV